MPTKRPSRARRLFVLTNRLPFSRVGSKWVRSAGGLVSALTPTLQRHPGEWIGWDGAAGRAARPFNSEGLSVRPVRLSEGEIARFYHGFSNRTLWPLYHDAIRTPEFHRDWWEPYHTVNRRFATAVARTARKGDLVWVHDYHLQLVPAMLRELRPDVRIGFFLHIPFPPPELFSWLPWRREVVQGLLGADVVGFQTTPSAHNFARAARRFADAEGTDTLLHFGGRDVHVRAFPISIDTSAIAALADTPAVISAAATIRRTLGSKRTVFLSVDRIDYTKGIDDRLRAFEQLLKSGAASVDDCVLIQIAVPSRESEPDYAEIRTRIEQGVARINGEFSRPGRVAVHYFRRSLPMEELVAYYKVADVMVVTPLKDGMNLVAKEFVAARTDNSGVLVLSEFAGAARELRRALLVNPRDVDGFTEVLREAMSLKKTDAVTRMGMLRANVKRHDVFDWSADFIRALEA